MAKKKEPKERQRAERSDKTNLKSVLVRLAPDHLKLLDAEAKRRKDARKAKRPDRSEVIREALDAHLKSKK